MEEPTETARLLSCPTYVWEKPAASFSRLFAFSPIDMVEAAAAMDEKFETAAAHRDKVSLSLLQPGQSVLIQCDKLKKWDRSEFPRHLKRLQEKEEEKWLSSLVPAQTVKAMPQSCGSFNGCSECIANKPRTLKT